MSQYGTIAVLAAKYVQDGMTPRGAWENASWVVIPNSNTARKKGCPRTAFLALYDSSIHSPNAVHARAARVYLQENPNTAVTPKELWNIVLAGEDKRHNSQMNVVLALHENHLMPD